MVCPNCASNMSDKKKRCDRCGTDMTVYQKVYRTSNLYYNNGLAKAKVRDLTGAATALRSSLELNKWNTNARNLLGLVYYEMGETVAALSEWVISKHFQPESNDADEYIEKVQSNPTRLDALNQAIKRYNTALGLAKQKSDDLAIIQLKKVITLNPHFIRAYQLLALLYIKAGENEKAKKYLLKAARIDVTNTTTLRYLQELDLQQIGSKNLDSNPEAETITTGSIMPISSYKEDKPNIMAFVNLVIGVVIGLAVMAFLVIPTMKKNLTSEDNSQYVDYGTQLSALEEKDKTIASLQTEKAELEQEIEQLKKLNESLSTKEDPTTKFDSLLKATELYLTELQKSERDRDYTVITDMLATVNDSEIELDTATRLLTTLKEATYPIVAEDYYDNGHDLYSSGKYEEAIALLGKAMTFDPSDVDAIYFTARSYHRMGDKVNAILYYNIVVTEYPDSSRIKDAKNFLKELQD